MSTLDAIEWDETRMRPQGQADSRPPVRWNTFDWDATKASAEEAFHDVLGRSSDQRSAEVLMAAAELSRLNGKSMMAYTIVPAGVSASAPVANEASFWNDLAEVRRTRPDALTDFARDRADFDAKFIARQQEAASDRARRMSQQGWVGNLAGGVAGSFTDPINIATLPLGGGGRTVASKIISEGLTQMGVEAAEQPLTALERNRQGREITATEMAWNVGLAGGGGAAFKGAGLVGGKAIAAAWDTVPLDVRAAIALRNAKPDYAMTPDQAAALHVIDRGAEIDGVNPFAKTYDGLEAHAARVDETIAAMGQWPDPRATPAYMAPRGRAARVDGVTPDFDNAWRAVIGIEGGTNRDGSFRTSPAGAIGPAQVMPDTAPEAARLAGLPWDEKRYRSDHAYNEALGQAYYRDLLRQFDGDPVKAAAAYNAGPGSARKGTGLRGAMARAERAGVPGEWVSFLPAETRKYVSSFRQRTGLDGEMRIGAGERGAIDLDGEEPARPAALDAQRPEVDMPDLDRALFRSDAEWQRAQGEVDAEAFGSDPAAARQAVWIEARDRLLSDRNGEVPGALWHPEIGAIDVKWGDAQTGLAKIAAKHPEVLDDLPELLEEMTIADRSREGRVTLESADHLATVRLDWDGKAQNWLLTAFQREEPKLRAKGEIAPSSADHMRAGESAGASPTAGALRDIALERAGVQMAPGIGDPGRYWEAALGRGERAKPVHAIVDRDGLVQGWETSAPRAARQLERLGLEDGRIAVLTAPRHGDLASHPGVRDQLEAEGLAGAVFRDAEAGKAFDDPAGEEVAKAAETAWHDVQAGQEAIRAAGDVIDQADAALRELDPKLAQGIDRELAAATQGLPEQMTFDLGDGRGERTLDDITAELKADEDAIAAIEACLKPAPMGGAA